MFMLMSVLLASSHVTLQKGIEICFEYAGVYVLKYVKDTVYLHQVKWLQNLYILDFTLGDRKCTPLTPVDSPFIFHSQTLMIIDRTPIVRSCQSKFYGHIHIKKYICDSTVNTIILYLLSQLVHICLVLTFGCRT